MVRETESTSHPAVRRTLAGSSEGPARAYLVAITLAAVVAVSLTPWSRIELDAIYVALVAAMAVGELLTVRLRPNAPGTNLLVVPAIVAFDRLGLAATPGLLLAVLISVLYRNLRGARLLSTVASDVLSFAVAGAIASMLAEEVISRVVFAVVLIAARALLWELAQITHAPTDDQVRPDPLLSLLLAPLATLPLMLGATLGDGGLLLVTAGVLAVLFVSREAANLSTARTEAEVERERLARSNELQDDLFHLISHDLKTPLAAVISYAQLGRRVLERNGDRERLATYLEGIEGAGQNMRRLVENLLQISSLERGEELPESLPVDLEQLAMDVASEYATIAAENKLDLKVEAGANTPPAFAHPSLLREALSNLVGNAVKYTPAGGSVTVWTRAGHPPFVEIGVTDNGIGISAEDQTRLFTKFYRSTDPRAQAKRGSGLGLSLTRNVVERMGGRIQVESKLDQGTTFRVALPVAVSVKE